MEFNSEDKKPKQPLTDDAALKEINESMNEINELFDSISESVDDDLEEFDISKTLSEMEDDSEDMVNCKGCKELCEAEDLNKKGICEDCVDSMNEELSIEDLEFETLGESKDMEGDEEESDDSESDDEEDSDDDEDDGDSLEDDEDDALLDDEFDEEDMIDGDDLIEQVISEDEIMESVLLDEQVEELTEGVDLDSINDEIDEILAESEGTEDTDINDLCIQESAKLEELLNNIDVLAENATEDTNKLNTIISENVSALPAEENKDTPSEETLSEVAKRRLARSEKSNLSIDQSLNGHNK